MTEQAAVAAIRDAGAADLEPIMAIERASFPTDAWSAGTMRATLVDPDAAVFVAADIGGVLGYAAVLAPVGSGDADILTIAVAAGSRGSGLGRALLAALLRAAGGRGARRVFLEVRADNPVAERLYASVGFEHIGRRRRYYRPDGVDALVMRLDLPEATP